MGSGQSDMLIGSRTPRAASAQPISRPCRCSSAQHKPTARRGKSAARLCVASRRPVTRWTWSSPPLHCRSRVTFSRNGWRITVLDSGRHVMRRTCMKVDGTTVTRNSIVCASEVLHCHVANYNRSRSIPNNTSSTSQWGFLLRSQITCLIHYPRAIDDGLAHPEKPWSMNGGDR